MIINYCCNCMENMSDNRICPHCGFHSEMKQNIPYALEPNTILHGKYLVGNVLGRGGFGITYIGLDLTLEMKVAIKEYFPSEKPGDNAGNGIGSLKPQFEKINESWRNGCIQFLSEAKKMAKINSIPEIVSVRDTFEANNTAYIVMDYVPGVTLKEKIRTHGTYTYTECVELLLPLIKGLAEIHQQGIIHRDISPDNLMLTPNGRVYLLDLGAAKDMKDLGSPVMESAKKGFSPIEQYVKEWAVGQWTDVYALAASIYYCIFGKVVPSSLNRYREDTLKFPKKGKNALTNPQIEVLKKALAVKPEFRYLNTMDFYIALRDSIKTKSSKRIRKVIGAIGIAVVLAVIAVTTALVLKNKPWLPVVEEYGTAGPSIESSFVIADGEYEYFTNLDFALVTVDYDKGDETFYCDQGKVVYGQNDAIDGDGVSGFNLTEDKLYFTYYGGEGNSDFLMSMNHNGTRQEEVLEIANVCTAPQYIRLSNDEEYFYYLMKDASDGEEPHTYLYRYDLQEDSAEQLLSEEVSWYAPYGKYLYYTVWDDHEEIFKLYRTTLAGDGETLLDETHSFFDGVVANDQLYLIQMNDAEGEHSVGFVACDEDGKPVKEGSGIFGIDWTNVTWTIGGGWIFYYEEGSDELYRIRLDGTEKSMILSGYQYHKLSYHSNQLFFMDGVMGADGILQPYQAYIAADDGSYVMSCGFEQDYMTNEDGVQFVVNGEEARIVGYSGTEKDVILPLEFNGYPINEEINWDEFNFVNVERGEVFFYTEIPESDLSYTSDSRGITITGYTGEQTGDYDYIALPTEIEGTPIVRIEEAAFAELAFSGVYLPKKLEEIGIEAFTNCTNLKCVVFPETLETIEAMAFWECSFEGQDVVLPEGILKLGSCFMFGCTPNSVYIPASLESVGDGFMACCGGEYIVDPAHEFINSVDGAIFSEDGSVLYAFPCDYIGSYTVPDGVKEIDGRAFYGCQVTSVTLPEGLETIKRSGFQFCKQMTSIYIPKSVTYFGEEAFLDTALTEVTINKDAKIESDAFESSVNIMYY